MSNELQMKLIDCTTCGGELEVFGNNYRCKNCNNVYEITENISEEEIIKLNMANSSRTRLLFDDALEIYEQILDKNPTSSEANWGAFLCDYGIIYEKDKDSIRYLPTCHRINERPVEKCKYFPYLVGDYIAKAKEIESLRKRILSESQKVNGYDVFICYKQTEEVGRITKEAKWARGIYEILTYKHNLRVFFAERSLSGSNVDYEPHIYSALRSSKLMIVLASSIEHVNSPWVKNEWKRYSKYVSDGEDKTIRVLYDDIEPYDLPKELQKKQAIDYNNLDWQKNLIEALNSVLKNNTKNIDFEVRDGVLVKYWGDKSRVVIPDYVRSIGNRVFYDRRDITEVIIPDSVTSIGKNAFGSCKNLKRIVIGEGVTNIDKYAFSYCCSLTEVEIPDSVAFIGDSAFRGCKSLENIVIGRGVRVIENYICGECKSLKQVEVSSFNETYKSIDGNLYSKDEKTFILYARAKKDSRFIVQDSVTSICKNAFNSCHNLTEVVISNSVTSIGELAFA